MTLGMLKADGRDAVCAVPLGVLVFRSAISQTEGSRAASQLGGKTVDLDGGMTSASGARARLYSKPVCLDVTVAVRSGSTAVHVHDGREELVRPPLKVRPCLTPNLAWADHR
jgi:hypothetical protein